MRSRFAALVASVAVVTACSSSPGRSSVPTTAPPTTAAVPESTSPASPAPAPASPPEVAVPPARWTACAGGAGPKGFQCATITVPRDPLHPGQGGSIGLAIDRRPATGARIGSLLVNPGGPGASGVDFLSQVVTMLPASVLARFDVVGFDPPGVARSAPVTCLDPAGLTAYFHADPAPSTAAGLAAVIGEDKTFAAGCQQRSGTELPYVSTVDAAIDMDYVRQAVGDPKLTYFGFSYGTFLGSTYAHLFPTRIRAMVLDGAIDPAVPPVEALDAQAAALDLNLRAALSACTSDPTCPWNPGPDPLGSFERLLASTRSSPLPASGTTRTVGPAEFLYGAAVTLYDRSDWKYLYQALAGASSGDGTVMLSLFDAYVERQPDGTYSNEEEANIAVNCLDAPAPPASAVEADAAHAAEVAPVFGVADLYSELQCDVWPVPATGRVGPVTAPGSPPIVVVGSTDDPATPYADAQALARELPRGLLLTRVGYGHTGYPYSSCVRQWVDGYLTTLAVPPAGLQCPSN